MSIEIKEERVLCSKKYPIDYDMTTVFSNYIVFLITEPNSLTLCARVLSTNIVVQYLKTTSVVLSGDCTLECQSMRMRQDHVRLESLDTLDHVRLESLDTLDHVRLESLDTLDHVRLAHLVAP